MTESEWLVSEDPAAMLHHWTAFVKLTDADNRKLALFAEACYLNCNCGSSEERKKLTAQAWVRLTEVPGCDCTKAFRAALLREIVGNPWRPVVLPKGPTVIREQKCNNPRCKRGSEQNRYTGAWVLCATCYGTMRVEVKESGPCPWLTDDVTALAAAAYEQRDGTSGALDPFRLLLLADALEEAGCVGDGDETIDRMYVCEKCDHVQRIEMGTGIYCRRCGSEFCRKQRRRDLPHPLLAHLRDAKGAPHYRGCHALDAILGRP